MEWRGQCSGTVEGTVLHCKRSEKADTPTFCEMSSFISKNVGVSAFSLLLQWSTVHSTTVHQSPLCHIALGHCPLHYMCSSRAQCPITSSFISKNVGVSAFSLLLQWSTVHSTTVHQSAVLSATLHWGTVAERTVLQCTVVERTVLHCKRSEKADTPTFFEMKELVKR